MKRVPSALRRKWRWTALLAGVILVLVLPWYAYKEVQIYLSLDHNEAAFIISNDPEEDPPNEGRNGWQRLLFALASLNDRFAAPVLIGIVPVALLAALADSTWRWFVSLLVLPTFLIWALLFSYDLRNLSLALPFAGTAAAVGLERLARLLRAKTSFRRVAVACALVLLPVTAWMVDRPRDRESLPDRQLRLQRHICLPELNEFLYAYYQSPGFRGKILGNNGYLYALPEIRELYCYDPLENSAAIEKHLARGDVRYILVTCHAHLADYFREAVSSGRFKRIGFVQDHELFEIAEQTQ